MTYAILKSRSEKQMKSYIDFLPYCEDNSQRFKLLDEIQDLKYKIQRIDRMTVDKYSQVDGYNETLNSEINFKPILRIA